MVEKCKFSNNKIIDVESTIKTTVLILDYQNYWNSAAAGWRWHNWNILTLSEQRADSATLPSMSLLQVVLEGEETSQQMHHRSRWKYHFTVLKRVYSHVSKIFQELAAAAPAQLQRVRVHTEAGACPAGARGRVHVQTSGWVNTWPRGIETMMGLQIFFATCHRQDVLVKRQIYSLYLVKRQRQRNALYYAL